MLASNPNGHLIIARTDTWEGSPTQPRFNSDKEAAGFVFVAVTKPCALARKAVDMIVAHTSAQTSTCTCNRPGGAHARGCNWLMIPSRGYPPKIEPP